MADQQDAQAPAQPSAQQPTQEQILRALNLWDDKKTAADNIAATRAAGLGDWLDKPRQMLERLKAHYTYDEREAMLDNLANFSATASDAVVKGVCFGIPAVAALAAMTYGEAYLRTDIISAAIRNPSVLFSSLDSVQKMRINTALATLAETPEGARLVDNLRTMGTPLQMTLSPDSPGGTVRYSTVVQESNIVARASRVAATGLSTEGALVSFVAHELRHLEQVGNRVMTASVGGIVSPESEIIYNRFVEADAQATATNVAWQLKEQGKPGAWNALAEFPWMKQVAEAFESVAADDPAALADGRAKRAAFDAWFTAETAPDGLLIADYYNDQGLKNIPNQDVVAAAVTQGARPTGDMTPEQYARVGGNGDDNYLTSTGGRPLDDPYYRRAALTVAEQELLQWHNERYASLRDKFNGVAAPADAEAILTAEAEGMPTVADAEPVPEPERGLIVDTDNTPAAPSVLAVASNVANTTVDIGMGAWGLAQGTMGAIRAYKEGDEVGVGINGANALSGATSLGLIGARWAGAQIPAAVQSTVTYANVGLTVATGLYQVMNEEGNFIDKEPDGSHNLGNRSERAVAVATTAGAGFALAAAGIGSAGVVPTVMVVAYTGDKAIEARRAWKETDRAIAANGVPQRIERNNPCDDGSPDFRNYKHLFTALLEASPDIRDSELPFTPTRNAQTGRISFEDLRRLDLKDPKVVAEFSRALDINIGRQQQIMKDNDSILPKWTRFDDGGTIYTDAQMVLADMQGAKTELGWYKDDQAAWNAAHNPASSRFTGPLQVALDTAEPAPATRSAATAVTTTPRPRA